MIGMFKDEAGGKLITEFVGLRSKFYSFQDERRKKRKEVQGSEEGKSKEEYNFSRLQRHFIHRYETDA